MNHFDPERITYFAKTDARGTEVPFGIKAKDRTRHVYVIGKSGMGKSTLLENMATQDIKNGEGFAFIDPHGQSAEALLDFIPEERLKDVLYFNPSDMAHPVAFNIMENVDPDKRFLVVSGLMSVFKKIWVDAWSARMEYILQNTLMALLEYPGATLLGVNRMLSDKAYREAVVDNVQDPSVKSFWVDEFAKYNERYMQEAGDSIKNKIGQFTANPIIRNIIGQPKSSFNIRDMMDNQKILIMNLSKGLIGETNANLLGSMLTTRIYLAAMSRADLSIAQMAKMPNFYFYVDEFQSFANATFANILSEARKYKLNLTIAHQYIDQMEEDVRNAVFGNVGTTITFRVGPLDAEVLEKIFMPQFTATDLVNLGFAQVYLTLMIDGIGSSPFSAVTLPPIKVSDVSYREVVVAQSRDQFARPRAEIETMIHGFHAEDFKKKRVVPEEGARPYVPAHERVPRSQNEHAPRAKAHVSIEEKVQSKDDLRLILQSVTEVAKEQPVVAREVATRPRYERPEHAERTASVKPVYTPRPSEKNTTENARPKYPPRAEQPYRRREGGGAVPAPEQPSDLRSALASVLAQVSQPPEPTEEQSVTKVQSTPSPSVHHNHQPPVFVPKLEDKKREVTEVHEAPPASELRTPIHQTPAAHVPTTHPKKITKQTIDVDKLRAHFRARATEMVTSTPQVVEPEPPHPTITPKALEHMMRVTTHDRPLPKPRN